MSAPRSAASQAPTRGPGPGEQPAPRTAALDAARAAAAVFGVVAAFHAAVALGAPWGELTQGGATTGTLPASGRLVAAVSCVLLLMMAGAILGRVGHGPFRRWRPRLRIQLAWATTSYAAVAVVLNLITRSTAERVVWAPVSVVLLGLVAFVMVASHRSAGSSYEGRP